MSKQVNAKLKVDGKHILFDAGEHKFDFGDEILVESKSGQEVACVVPETGEAGRQEDKEGEESKEDKEDKDKAREGQAEVSEFVFIRKLSQKDKEQIDKLSKEAKTYLIECQSKIDKYKLPMQLLDAELSYDEKKLTFCFTAPSRVDFRMLVSDLAHTFKKIIRLQQVGARDEARYLGGVGRCGQTLCCRRFLSGNLESVTLDMAADQNLAQMGSNRVTGCCGKLMCCLKYELDDYRAIKKKMPALGTKAITSEGEGEVIMHNILKNTYSVRLKEKNNTVEVSC